MTFQQQQQQQQHEHGYENPYSEGIPSTSGHSILSTTSCHSLSTGVTAHNTKPLPVEYVLGEYDVICGRGSRCFNHIGNQRFREIVESQLHRYTGTVCKHEKTSIICEIVKQVRANSPNGGFVKKDPETGLYYEVGDFLAREKTSQAFRDASEAYKSSNSTKKKKRLLDNLLHGKGLLSLDNKKISNKDLLSIRKSTSLPQGMGLVRSGSKRSLGMQNARNDSFKFKKNELGRQDSNPFLNKSFDNFDYNTNKQNELNGSPTNIVGNVEDSPRLMVRKSRSSDDPFGGSFRSVIQRSHHENNTTELLGGSVNSTGSGGGGLFSEPIKKSSNHYNTSLSSIFDTDWLEKTDHSEEDEFALASGGCVDEGEPLDGEIAIRQHQQEQDHFLHKRNTNSRISCPDFGSSTRYHRSSSMPMVNINMNENISTTTGYHNSNNNSNTTTTTACGKPNRLFEIMNQRRDNSRLHHSTAFYYDHDEQEQQEQHQQHGTTTTTSYYGRTAFPTTTTTTTTGSLWNTTNTTNTNIHQHTNHTNLTVDDHYPTTTTTTCISADDIQMEDGELFARLAQFVELDESASSKHPQHGGNSGVNAFEPTPYEKVFGTCP